jgi:ABC-type multidrug transport system fused ATPase/permease subunit
LILDESTSALDAPTEQLILEAIAHSHTEGILIIITHRLPSVSWVERLFVLDRGELISAGTHNGLYNESPLYRQLYESSSVALLIDFAPHPLLQRP